MTHTNLIEINIAGIGVSAGIAIAPAFCYKPPVLKIPQRPVTLTDRNVEMQRFTAARLKARDELQALQIKTAARLGDDTAAIFNGHLALLFDPMLEEAIQARIESGRIVEAAVLDAAESLSQSLRELEDATLSARASDVQDIGKRLLRILLGVPDTSLEALTTPSVIVASDLTPSDTVKFDPDLVKGVCLAAGSITSHAAILARTLNIPAVFGLGRAAIDAIDDGRLIALEGTSGEVVVNPSTRTLERFHTAEEAINARRIGIRRAAQHECYTADGKHVPVVANIGDVDSAQQAVEMGAEGVGLLRTEFLFLNAPTAPDEAHQIEAYQAIFDAMGDRPVTVRTLDLGGDKPPRFMPFPHENNPYLGWRGVRVSLTRPDLFKTQLRAILYAAQGHNVQVMVPMIESVATMRRVNQLFAEVRAELDAQGIAYSRGMPFGAMIETPSAAIQVDMLAQEADFFSIGTNDLTQYTLAVDRDGETVLDYFKPLNPAVLWLIQRVIASGKHHARPVTICGELASIPTAIPILLGMGLERFSVVPPAVAQTKWIINHFSIREAEQIARHALTLTTASDIETFVSGILRQRNLL